jgi:hypothetical protein
VRHVPWRPCERRIGLSVAVALVRGLHRIMVIRGHLTTADDGGMDQEPALYTIRISGHLGVTLLSAFPALTARADGATTVLSGRLDRSALYGVLAEIEALSLDLLEVRQLTGDPGPPEPGGCGPP